MKTILTLAFALVFTAFVCGQVSLQSDMPSLVESAVTVQIKINKGDITNFARYQMELPAGVIVQEGDSKGGTFTFENGHAKIFWASIAADPEITVSMKLRPGTYSGAATVAQKFYYMEDNVKKEMEGESIQVTFKADEPVNATNLGALPAGSDARADKLQAEQLKKDSKAAYKTGIREQEAADKRLAEADEALKKAEAIQNEEEKKAALKKANEQKQKANNDKAVASKILALAKTLDENADDIERLNRASGGSVVLSGSPSSGNAAAGSQDAAGNANSSNSTGGGTSSTNGNASAPSTPVSNNGTVYRLQLGAFAQNPEKVLYKHLGLINIVNENGMYKVMMGKFATREEAAKKRDEPIARSFDCFIVTYVNGVRSK